MDHVPGPGESDQAVLARQVFRDLLGQRRGCHDVGLAEEEANGDPGLRPSGKKIQTDHLRENSGLHSVHVAQRRQGSQRAVGSQKTGEHTSNQPSEALAVLDPPRSLINLARNWNRAGSE